MKRLIRSAPSWQEYQFRLQRRSAGRKYRRLVLKFSSIFTLAVAVIYGMTLLFSSTACQRILADSTATADLTSQESYEKQTHLLSKKQVHRITRNTDLLHIDDAVITAYAGGQVYSVKTSLIPSIQKFLAKHLDTRYSRDIGIVLMDPRSGHIHAMAGYDKTGKKKNPCIDGLYPAASLFKIVTAVAGIEKCGFSTHSNFTFNGGKYTLYRSQLRDRKNRYTNRISLKNSFAQSVNPVFGKIGANYLGKENLLDYAESFAFNQPINFELPLSVSNLEVTDRPYQWAEVACGFNRDTVITPLHGALISAAIANNGGMVEPSVIDSIRDQTGKVIYQYEPKMMSYVATPSAAMAVAKMMQATVRSGTIRKTFRRARRDRILSKLVIGGKTGSISSRKIQHVRYDWFVGYAKEKQGTEKLVVAVVVAHQKFIGKRAGSYAKAAIKQYFQYYFKKKQSEMHTLNTQDNGADKPA